MIYQIKPVIGKKEKNNLIDYIKKDNWITEHKVTENFEKNFSKFTNAKYCICFPNGTITMSSVLDCLNLKKDDEVLVITGNGAGYGNPFERNPELVLKDVDDELLTEKQAKELFGVIINEENHLKKIDMEQTKKLRNGNI